MPLLTPHWQGEQGTWLGEGPPSLELNWDSGARRRKRLVGKQHCLPRPSSPDGLENSTLWSSFSDDCVTAEGFRGALSEDTCGQNKELEMGPQDRLCSRGLVPASPGLTFCLCK